MGTIVTAKFRTATIYEWFRYFIRLEHKFVAFF